jgi:sugar fermentation stimulation protein A
MQLPPLTRGRILRRYQRFLADIELSSGERVVAHCPNTGSMATCWEPGAPVELSRSDNAARKLPWTLERVDMGAGWVGVNTQRTNAVMAEGILAGAIPALAGYGWLRREVPWPGVYASRLDLALGDAAEAAVWVEVKNVTLLREGCLRFPDAPSERGRRHLEALLEIAATGRRAVLLFALNRPEGRWFATASEVDPAYAEGLRRAVEGGVEVLAVRIRHTPAGMACGEAVEVRLEAGG